MQAPDPRKEIRLLSLRTIEGANYWSSFPVTRLDVAVGSYDEISSAEVPGVTETLLRLLPGLAEHRCSVGRPGGFVTRLRRGTYAPHIIEHVALELQTMIGHDVGFGRARGNRRAGESTVVFEHRHSRVGLEAALLSFKVVQRAFEGEVVDIAPRLLKLTRLARTPTEPTVTGEIDCGIAGTSLGPAVFRLLEEGRRPETEDRQLPPRIVHLEPDDVLRNGLPYAHSTIAVVADLSPGTLPAHLRDPATIRQLHAVVMGAVRRGGCVLIPAGDPELHQTILADRRNVAVFGLQKHVSKRSPEEAHALAFARGRRIIVQADGAEWDAGEIAPGPPAEAQVAAALAKRLLAERGVGAQPDNLQVIPTTCFFAEGV
jgi:hypothetical protein